MINSSGGLNSAGEVFAKVICLFDVLLVAMEGL